MVCYSPKDFFQKPLSLCTLGNCCWQSVGCSQCHRTICYLISQIPTAKHTYIYIYLCVYVYASLGVYFTYTHIYLFHPLCRNQEQYEVILYSKTYTNIMWNHQSCQKIPTVERRLSLTKWTANHKFHTERLFPIHLDFIIPLFLPVLWKQLFFTKAQVCQSQKQWSIQICVCDSK